MAVNIAVPEDMQWGQGLQLIEDFDAANAKGGTGTWPADIGTYPWTMWDLAFITPPKMVIEPSNMWMHSNYKKIIRELALT